MRYILCFLVCFVPCVATAAPIFTNFLPEDLPNWTWNTNGNGEISVKDYPWQRAVFTLDWTPQAVGEQLLVDISHPLPPMTHAQLTFWFSAETTGIGAYLTGNWANAYSPPIEGVITNDTTYYSTQDYKVLLNDGQPSINWQIRAVAGPNSIGHKSEFLMLGYYLVPEPSTYFILLAGFGIVFLKKLLI